MRVFALLELARMLIIPEPLGEGTAHGAMGKEILLMCHW